MRKIKTIFAFVIIALLFAACAESKGENGNGANGDIVKISGSTSVAPLMKEIEAGFEAESGIAVEIQESGSSSGIMSVLQGAAHLAMSSRDITQSEVDEGIIPRVIALDGIAVIVNHENIVENISDSQLLKIYSGEINNWAEVGGDDAEIIVITREDGSGTRAAFEEILGFEGINLSENALYESSTGAIKSNVMTAKYAIGYISYGSFDERTKMLKINDAACNGENIKNGSYILARPYYLCSVENSPESADKLLEYVSSEAGRKIITKKGYITVD